MKETAASANETRRNVLKRAGLFVVPTVTALQISKLSVAASGGTQFTDWADAPYVN